MNDKKQLLGLIGILAGAALLAVGITVFFLLQPSTLYALPSATETVNQNNYLRPNVLDSTNGQIGYLTRNWFGQKLVIIDAEDGTREYPEIDGAFRLLEGSILYTKNDSLKQMNTKTNAITDIAADVKQFAAYGEKIAYLTKDGALYLYNTADGKAVKQLDDVLQFYIHEEQTYAIQKNGNVVKLLKKNNMVSSALLQLKISSPETFLAMPCGDGLVYSTENSVIFVNIDTQAVREIFKLAEGKGKNTLSLICNDETVYVSFQAENGDHDSNGIWQIDAKTLKKEKICDKPFDDLYLYSADRLIAAEDGAFYEINIEGKTYQKISNP